MTTPAAEGPTPRTDVWHITAEKAISSAYALFVPAEFSRRLERELAAANRRIAESEAIITAAKKMRKAFGTESTRGICRVFDAAISVRASMNTLEGGSDGE